jgi:hypothetical protein
MCTEKKLSRDGVELNFESVKTLLFVDLSSAYLFRVQVGATTPQPHNKEQK